MPQTGLHGAVQVRALGQGALGSPRPRPRQCQQIAAGARGADNSHPPNPSLSRAPVRAAHHRSVSPPAPPSTQQDKVGVGGGGSALDFVLCKLRAHSTQSQSPSGAELSRRSGNSMGHTGEAPGRNT